MPRGTGGGGYLPNFTIALYLYAKINPAIWDVIVPMGPKYSKGTQDVLGSQVIKTVALLLKNASLKKQLNELGRALYSGGTKSMSYDDDGFICGNVPHPHFGSSNFFLDPAILVELNPQPLPPAEKYYGAILQLVSESVNNKEIASKLAGIAASLMETKNLEPTAAVEN